MPNRTQYGFRLHKFLAGSGPHPEPLVGLIATGTNFDVNGIGNSVLGPGDPITQLAGGTVTLCDGFEGAAGGEAVLGIVHAVLPYWDAANGVMVQKGTIPSGVAYGTNLTRQTKVLYFPAHWAQWEIDGDDATNATLAAWQLDIGTNFDHTLAAAVVGGRLNPKLDVATHVATTAQWRMVGIGLTDENQDPTAANYKVIVEVNEGFGGAFAAAGI
jgi:hypothetical protein